MRPPLDGSAVLVTGASAGLGRELARQLGPRARTLVIVARRQDRLHELSDELKSRHADLDVIPIAADLADRASTDAMLAALPPIDILINNAGLGDVSMFDLARWEKLEQLIAVNVTALTYLTHKLLPPMMRRGRGGILQVSSGFGLEFMPGLATYVGAKHYVTGFTESLRIEARAAGVVVSQLCPGPVATEFDEVAESFLPVPGFVRLSAESCVRWALRSFSRGRALIIPGVLMNVVLTVGALTPRFVKRLLYAPFARRARALQLEARPASR